MAHLKILDWDKYMNICKQCTAKTSNKNYCSYSCYWKSKKGIQGTWLNRGGGYNKGHTWNEQQKLRASLFMRGKRISPSTEFKIGQFLGEKHPNWKGGSSLSDRLRSSFKNREWIRKVFRRDHYTCQECGAKSCTGKKVLIEADHIIPFSYLLDNIRKNFPQAVWYETAINYEPLWDTKNGRTLCAECHKKTPTYAGKALTYTGLG